MCFDIPTSVATTALVARRSERLRSMPRSSLGVEAAVARASRHAKARKRAVMAKDCNNGLYTNMVQAILLTKRTERQRDRETVAF